VIGRSLPRYAWREAGVSAFEGSTALARAHTTLILDAKRVIKTIDTLQRRILERFPGAGLGAVCGELLAVAQASSTRAQTIAKRHVLLRVGLLALAAAGIGLLAWVLTRLDYSRRDDNLYAVFQGIEAVANLAVLTGGILLFVITIEQRLKRRRALGALHELRVILHVIDMHQLTKDPTSTVSVGGKTPSSPARTLTPYEVSRYLDYCSEMLSLTAKVAVLFAQSLPDPIVTEAVSDIERIASGMSQKVWQKISMLDANIRAVPSLAPPAPAAPVSGLAPPAQAGGAAPVAVEST
jgi:hypothetical protein